MWAGADFDLALQEFGADLPFKARGASLGQPLGRFSKGEAIAVDKDGDASAKVGERIGMLAKETGKDKIFLVGSEKTCCNVDARVKLARAKYKAAVEALVKALIALACLMIPPM